MPWGCRRRFKVALFPCMRQLLLSDMTLLLTLLVIIAYSGTSSSDNTSTSSTPQLNKCFTNGDWVDCYGLQPTTTLTDILCTRHDFLKVNIFC